MQYWGKNMNISENTDLIYLNWIMHLFFMHLESEMQTP